jgi:hypothetical protein
MNRKPDWAFLMQLEPLEPAVRELALAVRQMVREEAPDALEEPFEQVNAVALSYTFTEVAGHAFAFIAVYATWVNLGFLNGAEMGDPACVLRGDGLRMRYVRLASMADAEKAFVRNFLREAVDRARRAPKPEVKPEPEACEVKGRIRRRRKRQR